jgi:hypothetical protein
MQHTFVTAPVRRCWGAAAPVGLVRQSDRPHTYAILRCAVLLPIRAASDVDASAQPMIIPAAIHRERRRRGGAVHVRSSQVATRYP